MNGIPTYAERIPAEPSSRQIGVPARLAALSSFCVPRFGLVVKLKMPWPPGLSPVRNVDHAVGVKAGIVERSGPNVPSRASREMVGSFPSAMSRWTSGVVGAVEGEREDASHRPSTSR